MDRSHRSDPGPVEPVRGSEADIPSLEPLWVAVHHIHGASMPELAPHERRGDVARGSGVTPIELADPRWVPTDTLTTTSLRL